MDEPRVRRALLLLSFSDLDLVSKVIFDVMVYSNVRIWLFYISENQWFWNISVEILMGRHSFLMLHISLLVDLVHHLHYKIKFLPYFSVLSIIIKIRRRRGRKVLWLLVSQERITRPRSPSSL